jgi:hypothetical protein
MQYNEEEWEGRDLVLHRNRNDYHLHRKLCLGFVYVLFIYKYFQTQRGDAFLPKSASFWFYRFK